MAKKRPADPGKSTRPTDGEQLPQIDPLRLLWSVTIAALAIILAYSHAFPQAAYPLNAIAPSAGLVILTAATVLVVLRAPWLNPRALLPVLLPCFLFLWAAARTASARVPSEGVGLYGTLLQGMLVFSMALVLTAIGRRWSSWTIYAPLEPTEDREGKVKRREGAQDETSRLLLDCFLAFFLILALGLVLWAIYQYVILYDQKLAEFYMFIQARGRTIADLSAKEYAIVEALRAKRVGSTFGNSNVLAGFLSMVAPLAICAAVIWRDRSAKAAALAILGLMWYVVVLSTSRGGMLTLFFATGAGVALLGRRRLRQEKRIVMLAGGICVAALLLAIASANRSSRAAPRKPVPEQIANQPVTPKYSFFQRLRTPHTVAQRLYYLQSGRDMIRQSPWLGSGLGSYAVFYPKYKHPRARETRYPHNIVCHMWVELGLVGLFLLLAWVLVVAKVGLAGMRRNTNSVMDVGFRMLLLSAFVFALNNLFEMTWTFRETYLDWCLVLGAIAGFGASGSEKTDKVESKAASAVLPRQWQSPAIACIPLLLGAVFVNGVLLRPLIAASCQETATRLLKYGDIGQVENEIWQLTRRMIRFQPRNPWYHHWVAQFSSDMGREDRAREEFAEALRLHPDSATIHADFGMFEQKHGNFDRARNLLRKAVQIYPLNDQYHFLSAKLELETGNPKAALRHLDDALERVLVAGRKIEYQKFREKLVAGDKPTTETVGTP